MCVRLSHIDRDVMLHHHIYIIVSHNINTGVCVCVFVCASALLVLRDERQMNFYHHTYITISQSIYTTAFLMIIEGWFQAFQRFSSIKLILKTI
jgi:hypothetical protein